MKFYQNKPNIYANHYKNLFNFNVRYVTKQLYSEHI